MIANLIREKFVKTTAKAIDKIFCKFYHNPLRNLLKQFSKLYQLWGLSRDHYWRGGIQEIIFEVLGEYLSKFLLFLREIFLVARSYRVLVINIKTLIMSDLFTLETKLKVPTFGILGIFRPACFGTSL